MSLRRILARRRVGTGSDSPAEDVLAHASAEDRRIVEAAMPYSMTGAARLRALQQRGAAIVMVSHSMHMIRQLCPRAILIRHGRVEYDGDIEQAIALHCASVSTAESGQRAGAVEVVTCRLIGV